MMNPIFWSWNSPVWLLIAALVVAWLWLVRGQTTGQQLAWLFGLVVLAIAFVSPIGVLADGYLFAAHMVQHLLMLLVVPLCFVLGLPKNQLDRCFRAARWERLGRTLSIPPLGWSCGVGAMWFWHIPALCSAAALYASIGVVRDASLVAAGIAFWWPIYAPSQRFRLPELNGMLYLFSACLGCTVLGIYITFAPLSVCPVFANPVDRLGILNSLYDAGLTPGVDQHLGGLIMWVPPCLLYTCAIISLLGRWYSSFEPAPIYTSSKTTSTGS